LANVDSVEMIVSEVQRFVAQNHALDQADAKQK
jgi:hypothetical protein